MSFVFASLRLAALFALVRKAWQQSDSSACNAEELAGALSSARESASKELWRLCNSRYSKGVCISARRTLSAELPQKPHGVSLQQLASTACRAVEGAASQQHALLLRQYRSAQQHHGESVESHNLDEIRRSASVHRLSLDVARRYRAEGQAALRTGTKMNDALQHKSLLLPHARFDWEYNHSKNSSSLDKAVEDWKKAHREKINETSPEVVHRANAFRKFVSNSSAPKKKAESLDEVSDSIRQNYPIVVVDDKATPAPPPTVFKTRQVVPRAQTAKTLTALGVPDEAASQVGALVNEVMVSSSSNVERVEINVDRSPMANPPHPEPAAPLGSSKTSHPPAFSMNIPIPFPLPNLATLQSNSGAQPKAKLSHRGLARAISAKATGPLSSTLKV